jgi:hypothetical protein
MFTHTMLKSQSEALVIALKLKVHDWDKVTGHSILTEGSGRSQTVVGAIWPIPRQPNYDEDQVRVFLDRKVVLAAFEHKVRAAAAKANAKPEDVNEWAVGIWGEVTEWGKYGPMKVVQYVLEQIQQGA